MNSLESARMARRLVAVDEAFQKATRIMSTQVSMPVSDRYNALYRREDLHRSLMALSIANSFAESGMQKLAVESAGGRVPSGSWVRGTVEKVPAKETLAGALGSTLAQVRSTHSMPPTRRCWRASSRRRASWGDPAQAPEDGWYPQLGGLGRGGLTGLHSSCGRGAAMLTSAPERPLCLQGLPAHASLGKHILNLCTRTKRS